MAEIERIYTIPLRKGWLKEPRSKRSNRALREIEKFVRRHTKSEKIKISKGVNEFVFARGFKKPPGRIKVEVRGDSEKIEVRLPGEPEEKREEKKKGIAGLKEKLIGKGEEKPPEGKVKKTGSEERVEKAKNEEKKEFKEERKKK